MDPKNPIKRHYQTKIQQAIRPMHCIFIKKNRTSLIYTDRTSVESLYGNLRSTGLQAGLITTQY